MSEGAPTFFCLPVDVPGRVLLELSRVDLPRLQGMAQTDAFTIFMVLVAESHRGKRNYFFEVVNGDAAHSLRLAIGKSVFLFQTWNCDRIRLALDVLRARGFLVTISESGKEWLAVAELWRHVPAAKPRRTPSGGTGPPAAGPDADGQGRLDLMGEIGALPSPSQTKKQITNQNRGREDAQESEGGIRALSRSDDSGRFARDEGDSDDEVWRDLCEWMPTSEMLRNGAMWKDRLEKHRRALALALSDAKSRSPKETPIQNRGAFLTQLYEQYVKEAA